MNPINPRDPMGGNHVVGFTIPDDSEPFYIGEGYILSPVAVSWDIIGIRLWAEAHVPRIVGRLRAGSTGMRVCVLRQDSEVPRGARFLGLAESTWGTIRFVYQVG